MQYIVSLIYLLLQKSDLRGFFVNRTLAHSQVLWPIRLKALNFNFDKLLHDVICSPLIYYNN